MIRAVLFDVGGVIFSSPFEAFANLERERGLPAGFLRQVNATNHHENAWARLERSEIDTDEFARAFAEESADLGHRVDGGDVLAVLVGEIRPQMVEALRRCHLRLRTAMLTNNFVGIENDDSERQQSASMFAGLFQHFDVIVESSRVGLRKPDPASTSWRATSWALPRMRQCSSMTSG